MSTSVEQFKQLYRIHDARGVAVLVAVIGLGLSAAFNTAVTLHALTGSRNVYFPNLDDKDPILMIEPIFWIAAFVLLLMHQRRLALIAGGVGSLLAFVEVIRQATDGGEVFAYQPRPVQILCVGIIATLALIVAKNEPFPDINKFMEITAGAGLVALIFMAATKPWKESEFSFVQGGWSLDVVTEIVIVMLYVGAFLYLWKNARFLIAIGLLGVAQMIATLVAHLQSTASAPYVVPNLLTGALWVALPVALGNIVLSQAPVTMTETDMSAEPNPEQTPFQE